ncbi:hypothetical protein [Marinigracilibium pacificum]|uniref:Uncharacterized protein n=1 Tax=Marinigracilibium pacificum TaxID=2729599 RepID=A0A848IX61_9BACT|nr:hypothetical protein [Marinigracilibium pacificum]NMM46844.1 hypothetical protein [Marinigracilibium pacificum]
MTCKYTFLVFFCFLICCNPTEKTGKTIEVKSAKVKFQIPEYYAAYKSGLNEELDFRMQAFLKQFKGTENSPVVFVDSNDHRNTIVFFPWNEYIDLNSRVAGIYLGLLNQQFRENVNSMATSYNLLERKHYEGNSQLVKIKYEVDYDNQVQYSTNYLVSVGNRTFAIYHNTYNLGEDLEVSILALKAH